MRWFFSPALRFFAKDPWTRFTVLPAALVTLAAAAWVLTYFPRQESAILHYNVYFGIDLLGRWYEALLIPVSAAVLTAVNTVTAAFLWRRDRVASALLGLGTILVSGIAAAAVGLLTYVNR